MRRTTNGVRRTEGDGGLLLACASSEVPRLFADDVLTCCARRTLDEAACYLAEQPR